MNERLPPFFGKNILHKINSFEKGMLRWGTDFERTYSSKTRVLQGFSLIVKIFTIKWLYFSFFFVNSDKIS